MTKYFLDTEFIESGATKPIQLISIGIVSETGAEFYAQLLPSTTDQLLEPNDFVARHVFPELKHFDMGTRARSCTPSYTNQIGVCSKSSNNCPWRSRSELVVELIKFCDDKPEFWGYYADYDWVVLCQLFGSMVDLPYSWPKYCLDVKQFAVMLDNPLLPDQLEGEHNALEDAKHIKLCHEYLNQYMFTYKGNLALQLPSTHQP